jgi:hypothetical protein
MSWCNSASRGGNLDGLPAVGSNQDGILEVFALWKDRTLRHIWRQQSETISIFDVDANVSSSSSSC